MPKFSCGNYPWGVPEELIDAAGVAELLGVSRSYVNRLARAGDLPEPEGVLTNGQRVWKRTVIETWSGADRKA